MNSSWQSAFNLLENKRQHLFKILDNLSEDDLNFKPDKNSWSILHVCHHLIKSEELSLQYLNKKLQFSNPIAKAGIGSSIRSYTLNFALRLPIKYSAPNRVSDFPERMTWIDLQIRWQNVRQGMLKRLDSIPTEIENTLVYKHPSIGRLTIYQMLSFFIVHITRHEKQIERLVQMVIDKDRSRQ